MFIVNDIAHNMMPLLHHLSGTIPIILFSANQAICSTGKKSWLDKFETTEQFLMRASGSCKRKKDDSFVAIKYM